MKIKKNQIVFLETISDLPEDQFLQWQVPNIETIAIDDLKNIQDLITLSFQNPIKKHPNHKHTQTIGTLLYEYKNKKLYGFHTIIIKNSNGDITDTYREFVINDKAIPISKFNVKTRQFEPIFTEALVFFDRKNIAEETLTMKLTMNYQADINCVKQILLEIAENSTDLKSPLDLEKLSKGKINGQNSSTNNPISYS